MDRLSPFPPSCCARTTLFIEGLVDHGNRHGDKATNVRETHVPCLKRWAGAAVRTGMQ